MNVCERRRLSHLSPLLRPRWSEKRPEVDSIENMEGYDAVSP